MRKSPLTLYLQRASKGDSVALAKLLPLFAERLVFVPVVNEERTSGTTRVSVVTISTEKGSAVPAFTEEPLFRTWCSAQGRSHESLSLLGADLCAALASGRFIVIDDLTDQRVILSPDAAAIVAAGEPTPTDSAPAGIEDEQNKVAVPKAEPIAIVPVPDAPRVVERDIDDVSATVEVPDNIASSIAAQHAPPVQTQDTHPPSSSIAEIRVNPLTASSTKILRSPRPIDPAEFQEEQPKKKSFLSFLRSGRK